MTMEREQQIRSKAKELGQKYFPDEANVWARGNIEAEYVESACVEMAEWLDKHPHWESVKDSLPEDDECCLIYSDSGIDFGSYDSKIQYWFSEYSGQPTHWMPLPAPPTTKGGQE